MSRLVNAPAGVTQEEGDTGFLQFPFAVLASIFVARRIQLLHFLVDNVENCVLKIKSSSTCWYYLFYLFAREESFCHDSA